MIHESFTIKQTLLKNPLNTLITLLLPFACGVMYGLMALGMKADREVMMAAARSQKTFRRDMLQDWQNVICLSL